MKIKISNAQGAEKFRSRGLSLAINLLVRQSLENLACNIADKIFEYEIEPLYLDKFFGYYREDIASTDELAGAIDIILAKYYNLMCQDIKLKVENYDNKLGNPII